MLHSTRIDLRYIIGAATVIVMAVLGLLHVRYGTWRPGPGGGPALVPVLAYLAIVPSAATMIWQGLRRPDMTRTEAIRLWPVLACTLWAVGYFWLVRTIGMVTATALALTFAMAALSPDPLRSLRIIVPVVIICAAAFWIMFTQVAPIIQMHVLLF